MNRNLLIDGLVRQMIVTIAQLATTDGARTPLAHVANEVFLGLAKELEEQGVGRKVIADMFGLTLRAYHSKVRRLSESRTVRGRSLWTAVLEYVTQRQSASRADVERRFSRDGAANVAGILNDLVKSHLLFKTGDGPSATYRVTTPEDIPSDNGEGAPDTFLWAEIFRSGPLSFESLSRVFPTVEASILRDSLLRLEEGRQIERVLRNGQELYSSGNLVIPVGAEDGWEAAVLDHFRAVARTIAAKAQGSPRRAGHRDEVGGSTFHFDLSDGHPLELEVLALFQRFRQEASELRVRVDDVSSTRGHATKSRVTLYLGHIRVHEEDA